MPKKSTGLPKYVKKSGKYYVYRPYIPAKERANVTVDKYGYLAPPIKLCPINAPEHQLHTAYAEVLKQKKYEKHENETWPYLSLGWLSLQYLDSRLYRSLEIKTQKDYAKRLDVLDHPITVNGQKIKLGQLPALQLKTTTIRRILDKRLDQYQAKGLKGESRCNNEKAVISAMFKYGIQYIDDLAEIKNPAHAITKFNVTVRKRYVTPEEYDLQYTIAKKHAMPYLPIVMELAYFLAARGVEVTDLTVGSANEIGIHVKRRKGSRDTLIKWNKRLKTAWSDALSQHKIVPTPNTPLLIGKGGNPVTRGAVSKAWQKIKAIMEQAGHKELYFVLHDLKRRGVSNAEDDKIAGHISESIRSNYKVSIDEYSAPDR